MNRLTSAAAVIAALVANAALSGCAAQVAKAKREAAVAAGATEPCFGIAQSGKNDCRTSKHVCAGWASQAHDTAAFIYLPAGTCTKLVGGQLAES